MRRFSLIFGRSNQNAAWQMRPRRGRISGASSFTTRPHLRSRARRDPPEDLSRDLRMAASGIGVPLFHHSPRTDSQRRWPRKIVDVRFVIRATYFSSSIITASIGKGKAAVLRVRTGGTDVTVAMMTPDLRNPFGCLCCAGYLLPNGSYRVSVGVEESQRGLWKNSAGHRGSVIPMRSPPLADQSRTLYGPLNRSYYCWSRIES